jgi:hypothetical protein
MSSFLIRHRLLCKETEMNYKTPGKERRTVKMADDNDPTVASGTEQLELSFPDPDEFPSYDEVDSDDGESELPGDSFDEAVADFDREGCGCV